MLGAFRGVGAGIFRVIQAVSRGIAELATVAEQAVACAAGTRRHQAGVKGFVAHVVAVSPGGARVAGSSACPRAVAGIVPIAERTVIAGCVDWVGLTAVAQVFADGVAGVDARVAATGNAATGGIADLGAVAERFVAAGRANGKRAVDDTAAAACAGR